MRVTNHPVLKDKPAEKTVNINFNGAAYEAYEGDTVASALLAHKIKRLRRHEESGNGRGIYCNIGHCYECRVKIDGRVERACLTPVRDGMEISPEISEEGGVSS